MLKQLLPYIGGDLISGDFYVGAYFANVVEIAGLHTHEEQRKIKRLVFNKFIDNKPLTCKFLTGN